MPLRPLIFWSHLSAGLVAGLVILLMCVTGVLLTYERQLIAWSDRGYRSTPPTADAVPLALDDLARRVRHARPDLDLTALTVAADPEAPIGVSFGRQRFYADAYSGALLGEATAGVRAVMSRLRAWHRWLGVDGDGRNAARAVTGWANVLFLFIVVSGLYLWVPRTLTRLRQAIWFRRGLRGKARDFNWHNVIGVWLAIPLFIVVISATPISFSWAGALVARLAGDEPEPGRRGRGPAVTQVVDRRGGGPAGMDELPGDRPAAELQGLLARVMADAAEWRTITVELPRAPGDEVSFAVDGGDGGQPQLRSTVTVEHGALTRRTFADERPGQRLRRLMRFGHTGEVLGLPGQTVAGLASAGGAVLMWTGLALAWRRFRGWTAGRRGSSVAAVESDSGRTVPGGMAR